MRLKLIKSCVIAGYPGLRVGQVFDAPEKVAGDLLAIRVVEEASSFAKATEDRQGRNPEVVENREPVVESRDPIAKKAESRKQKAESRSA